MEERKKKIREVLCAKAKEYATDENRFHNFDEAARLLNCTPKAALEGMLVKHWVSVMDLIDATPPVAEALINEKVGDAINYVILKEGLRLRYVDTFEDVVEDYIVFVQPYIGGRGFTRGDMEQLWSAGLSSRTIISYLATLEQILYRRNEKQPEYRPYTASELFDLYVSQKQLLLKGEVRATRYKIINSFCTAHPGEPLVYIQNIPYSPKGLLKYFVRSDGSPCGVKVVNNGH